MTPELLPQLSWSLEDKGENISCDGLTIKYIGSGDSESMIFTTNPVPKDVQRYYFEATIHEQGKNGSIGIGLVKADRRNRNGRMPGWDISTVGYHGDDGGIFQNSGRPQMTSETFGKGDVVGCLFTRLCFYGFPFLRVNFIKNGIKLKVTRWLEDGDYYPAIGIASSGAIITTNMGGQSFIYNLIGNIIRTILLWPLI